MRSGIKIKREVKNKKLDLVWEIKRFERGKTGEDIRREGGEMVGIKT